jgi:hypothetical protein
MGNFIKKALNSLVANVVAFMFSIATIVFLLVADVVALVVYPFWAWKNPEKAAQSVSLAETLNWHLLEDVVNPRKSWEVDCKLLAFFQFIMRPIDAFVIGFWNKLFWNYAPMKKRKYFIELYSNQTLQSYPFKVQEDYFYHSDFERQVYLVKYHKLSAEVLDRLFDYNIDVFAKAGQISDQQFEKIIKRDDIKVYVENNKLSLLKQKKLIFYAVSDEKIAAILKQYILQNGLHPKAVEYLFTDCTKAPFFKDIPKLLKCRQDLVIIQKTNERGLRPETKQMFVEYLKERKMLDFVAQVEMSAWQYRIFHELGLKLQPNAIYAKLASVNKNQDAENFVALMMAYGEADIDELAKMQIAGDAKLSTMWVIHLAQVL